jgi:hypothetical protein
VTPLDNDRYKVDSQVSYTSANGRKIDLAFHAVLQYKVDGEWHLVTLQID